MARSEGSPDAESAGCKSARTIAPLPTYAMVVAALGLKPDCDDHPESIPWDSFAKVIQLFIRCIPVDEVWYRVVYPDVAEAINAGEMASAKQHFVDFGYFEGRSSEAEQEAPSDSSWDGLAVYVRLSQQIPGWTRGPEAEALAMRCYALPDGATVVEIGSFLGSGSTFLAGARKIRGSGQLHCVDTFDGGGDEFSMPHYQAILMALGGRTLREQFDENIRALELGNWVTVHQGTAEKVAAHWSTPIDLLFIDGDQSPVGARSAYLAWVPWLKVGGVLALHNSDQREDAEGQDGHFQVAQEFVHEPAFQDVKVTGSITFARKVI